MTGKDILAVAVEYTTKQIDLHPTVPSHYLDRGRIYMMLGDREKAFLDFRKALSLEPGMLSDVNGTISSDGKN